MSSQSKPSSSEIIDADINEINNLTKSLETYAQNKAAGIEDFQQIINEFASIYRETFVTSEQGDAQVSFLIKLDEIAKTADEIYAIHQFYQDFNRFYNPQKVDSYVHKAAELGHPLALRTVASLCMLGIYSNQQEAITFGIKTIKQLRTSLSDGTVYSDEVRQALNEDLLRAESRYADIFAIKNIDNAVAYRIVQLAVRSKSRMGDLAQTIIDHKTYNYVASKPKASPESSKIESALEESIIPTQESSTTTNSASINWGFMLKCLSSFATIAGVAGLIIATMGISGVGFAAGLAALKPAQIAIGGGILAGLGTLGLFATHSQSEAFEADITPSSAYAGAK